MMLEPASFQTQVQSEGRTVLNQKARDRAVASPSPYLSAAFLIIVLYKYKDKDKYYDNDIPMYMLLSAVLELTESSVATLPHQRGPRQPTNPHSVVWDPHTHGHKPRHHYHGRVTSVSLLVRVGPGSPESGLMSKAYSTLGEEADVEVASGSA